MLYYLKLYFRDHWVQVSLVASLFFQVFLWIYLILNINSELDRVFLHYNIVFGVDLVGAWWQLYYLPVAGLVIMTVNTIFAYPIYKVDKFLSRLLNAWIVFFHIFLSIATFILVRLNV